MTSGFCPDVFFYALDIPTLLGHTAKNCFLGGLVVEKHILILATTNDFLLKFEGENIALLQEMGYQVHYGANLREPAYLSDGERIRAKGVALHHLDIARSPYLLGENRRALEQVLELVKQWKVCAIHCHTPVGGLVGRLAGRMSPLHPVVVYTAHGFHFYRGAPLYNRMAFYPVEWNLARYTDLLVTINQEDYRAARRLPLKRGGKVFRLPGVGLDRQRFSPLPTGERQALRESLGLAPDDLFLLSLGELNLNKNHQVVLAGPFPAAKDTPGPCRGAVRHLRGGLCQAPAGAGDPGAGPVPGGHPVRLPAGCDPLFGLCRRHGVPLPAGGAGHGRAGVFGHGGAGDRRGQPGHPGVHGLWEKRADLPLGRPCRVCPGHCLAAGDGPGPEGRFVPPVCGLRGPLRPGTRPGCHERSLPGDGSESEGALWQNHPKSPY